MVDTYGAKNGNGFFGTSDGTALLTVTQVAQHLNAHPHSVRRWADSGLIHCYRIGFRGDRRFKPDDVKAFLVARTNGFDHN